MSPRTVVVERKEMRRVTHSKARATKEALKWFVQSQRMNFKNNPITDSYLEIVQRKLAEKPAIRPDK